MEEEKGDGGLDLIEEVDVLGKCDTEWQERTIDKKTNWKDRQAAMETLNQDLNLPKVKLGDYSGAVRVVKQLLSDPMGAVAPSAIKVCTSLARKFKKDFAAGAKELIVSLLLKFKDKKTSVIEETHAALEAFQDCTNIEALKDEFIDTGLKDASPSVRKQTCLFLEGMVQKTYIDVLQRVSGDFLAQLMKMSDDSDADVRNSALSLLGIFKGRLGDSAMSNLLKDMIA